MCQGLRGLVAVAQDGTLLHTTGAWSQEWLRDHLLVEMFREQFDAYTPHTDLFLRRPEAGIVCGKYVGPPEFGNLYECASASERADWGLCPLLAVTLPPRSGPLG